MMKRNWPRGGRPSQRCNGCGHKFEPGEPKNPTSDKGHFWCGVCTCEANAVTAGQEAAG